MTTTTSLQYSLGTMRGLGSIPRIYNFCRSDPRQSKCLDLFIRSNPTPPVKPVPGKMKTVFLLELTGGYVENDITMKKTLNYYWNTYPQEFTRCPIVDTGGSLNKTLKLLQKYYNLGFTRFVGFSRSTIVKGVLEWFNSKPNAIGISATSSDPTLNVPKNIFRMTPTDKYMIDTIRQNLESKTVHYIYSSNENAPVNLIPYIEDVYNITVDLVPITSTSDFTTTLFKTKVNSFSDYDVILIYVLTDREVYLNLYGGTSPELTFAGIQYDILGIVAPTIETPNLSDLYNTVTFKGISTSILWRNGFVTLNSNNFSTVIPNILNLLSTISNNELIDNINSHSGILQFDEVSKDLLFPSFLIEKYVGSNTFITTNLYVEDPYLGLYTAAFLPTTPVPTSIIPVSPKKSFSGKAIAFLEIYYITGTDSIINESLYYFWYKDSSLPRFPIVDISNLTTAQIATQLTASYNEGYRIFLGPNQSYRLATNEILDWFSSHPSTICMSLISGVTIPTIPKNIYRLNYNSSQVISIVITVVSQSTGVYYICDNDPIGIGVGLFLQNYCGINSIPYQSFVVGVTGELTAPNIRAFLFDSIATDIVPLVLNTNLQNYLDLYNDPLLENFIVASQYIATIFKTITVPPVLSFDNKLFSVGVVQSNSSFLWNENRQYLSDKYSTDVTSYETLNALKMTQYFLKGKDVSLLGSHSGVLQFSKQPSSYNNIIYPSILQRQYKLSAEAFVNFKLYFDDPVLGNFIATF